MLSRENRKAAGRPFPRLERGEQRRQGIGLRARLCYSFGRKHARAHISDGVGVPVVELAVP